VLGIPTYFSVPEGGYLIVETFGRVQEYVKKGKVHPNNRPQSPRGGEDV
jgi:hypothetical protein